MSNQDTLTSKLTGVANAIRAKTGDSGSLTIDGMATAISNMSGGDGYLEWYNDLCGKTQSGSEWSIDFDAEYIPALSNYLGPNSSTKLKLTECNLPNLKKVNDNAFRVGTANTTTVDRVVLPKVTSVGSNSFYNFVTTNLSLPLCTTSSALSSCRAENYYMPKLTGLADQHFGSYTRNVLLTDSVDTIGTTSNSKAPFRGATSIERLILWTPDAMYDPDFGLMSGMPELGTYLTYYAHNNSSNRFYNGSAKIYVPKAALSAYENYPDWSIYYGAGAILGIEDYRSDLQGIFPELDAILHWDS